MTYVQHGGDIGIVTLVPLLLVSLHPEVGTHHQSHAIATSL